MLLDLEILKPDFPRDLNDLFLVSGTNRPLMRFNRREGGPMNTATYYAQLEEGARYLASLAANESEKRLHLSWANRYHQLRVDATSEASTMPIAA